MPKKVSNQITYWLGIVAIGLITGLGIQFVQAGWTEPTGNPGAVNVAAPINVSANLQTKAGDLIVANLGVTNITATGDINTDGKLTATGDICTDAGGGKCLSSAGGGGGCSWIQKTSSEETTTASCPSNQEVVSGGCAAGGVADRGLVSSYPACSGSNCTGWSCLQSQLIPQTSYARCCPK